MKKEWSMQKKLMGMLMVVSAIAITQLSMMAVKQMLSVDMGMNALTSKVSSGVLDKIDRNLFERYGDVQAFAASEPARSGNPARITAFMNDMIGMYAPVYDLMMVVNLEGRVIAVNGIAKTGEKISSNDLLGRDFSREEWFKKAVEGKILPGQAFVESTHVDKSVAEVLKNDGLAMNFTAPIRDRETGRVLGVWTNRMSWNDVVAFMLKEETTAIKAAGYDNAFFTIIGPDGKFLFNPDETKNFKEIADGFESFKSESKIVSKKIDNFKSSYFNGAIYQATAPSKGYSSYEGLGWRSQVQLPASNQFVFWGWVQLIAGLVLQGACWVFGWWLIRRLSNNIASVMEALEGDSDRVRGAASSITMGAQNLASASTEQASALQETASSIEEMSAMVKRSADNAEKSRGVAELSQTAAARGKNSVSQMMTAIGEINTANERIMSQVEESNRQITEIVQVITEIGNKTKVINDIVFQTKLLSFNASVEAARAGEHGKGFAVVAEEVGNLAQMSGNASKEIADMLNGSISKVEGIISDTKSKVERLIAEGKMKVESGTLVARQCGEILDEVVQNVTNMTQMSGEISTASREQASGINEITRAMNQLDQVTHENAQTSQQAATSAEQLSHEADSLSELILRLRTIVHGGAKAENFEHSSWTPAPRETHVEHKVASVAEMTEAVTEIMPISPEPVAAVAAPKVTLTSFREESAPMRPASRPPVKQVSNSDVVPSENDPRFMDV